MSASRQTTGKVGGLTSWAHTVDRTLRTDKPRRSGPGQLEWHLARLDHDKFANATDAQKLAAAEAAKKAYYAALAMRSATARSRRGDAA